MDQRTQGAGEIQGDRLADLRQQNAPVVPEPDPVLDAVENQRAILAAKVYDDLSMLVTCASCGGEHGKGAMIPLLNAREWCVLQSTQRPTRGGLRPPHTPPLLSSRRGHPHGLLRRAPCVRSLYTVSSKCGFFLTSSTAVPMMAPL
jgi:hypothetical protein